MPDNPWTKLRKFGEALPSPAGAKAPTTAPPRSPSPTLPENTIINRRPLSTKDMNLPLKGSVVDPDPSTRAKPSPTKIGLRRASRSPAMSRRA